ncbi:N4-gp56 family major capsid protein [Butyricicoccus pullicaecorum]|uniref:N4-gp56 family major capsid protein n=1 Tax=Butyricicoccus pullicaecorum TaxID=501571 RepID=UPI00352139A2
MSFKFDYQLFAINTTETMPDEIKTYYDDYLIDCSSPKLVHDQFGQKRPIPAGRGKTIEFRKVSPLPVSTTPLTEGVTPESQQLTISTVEAPVQQYGGYVELSDMVVLTAIDNNLVIAAKQLGAQAGKTLDAITREVLAGGTNVQYAEGQVTERSQLVGGKAEGNHYLTVDAVRRAVRTLKKQDAEPIGDSFIGIIHPDVAYDLMSDPKWVNVKSYSDPEGIYEGEIGKIENVRFVETSEAKVFEGAGAEGRDVYATLILGDNAYGTTEIEGGGLTLIVKQLGSGGASDPLDQRASVAWKATKAAVRLQEAYMVRIETTSTFTGE